MGALFTDCVLQAGVNYKTTVLPRVQRVLDEYPQAYTTSIFQETINNFGASSVLSWKHPEKPERLTRVTTFFYQQLVETEEDLVSWLTDENNITQLRQIKGIGPKTTDYMKRLVNIPSIPVDRHMFRFVEDAGITCTNYSEVQTIIETAGDFLEIHLVLLDRAIWSYMSQDVSDQIQLFP
jgi:endonuclease III